jgi:hypothetical protein
VRPRRNAERVRQNFNEEKILMSSSLGTPTKIQYHLPNVILLAVRCMIPLATQRSNLHNPRPSQRQIRQAILPRKCRATFGVT